TEKATQRPGAHCGQIGKIDCQGFVPERHRIDIRKKMPPLHEKVGTYGQLSAGLGRHQGTIVAWSQKTFWGRTREKAPDKIELAAHTDGNRKSATCCRCIDFDLTNLGRSAVE